MTKPPMSRRRSSPLVGAPPGILKTAIACGEAAGVRQEVITDRYEARLEQISFSVLLRYSGTLARASLLSSMLMCTAVNMTCMLQSFEPKGLGRIGHARDRASRFHLLLTTDEYSSIHESTYEQPNMRREDEQQTMVHAGAGRCELTSQLHDGRVRV